MLSWITKKVAGTGGSPEAMPLEVRVRSMKEEGLARARKAVQDGLEPAAFAGKPGLSHYVRAMRQVCVEHNLMLPERSILDLSGLRIEGFAFTADDFSVAQEEIAYFSQQPKRESPPGAALYPNAGGAA